MEEEEGERLANVERREMVERLVSGVVTGDGRRVAFLSDGGVEGLDGRWSRKGESGEAGVGGGMMGGVRSGRGGVIRRDATGVVEVDGSA